MFNIISQETQNSTEFKLSSVRQITAVEAVVQQLFEFIDRSKLSVGDRLPSEQELMTHLDVGRSTVREALQRLAVLGLVEGQAGRGWVVMAPQGSDLSTHVVSTTLREENPHDLFELRLILDVEISALAASHATDEDIEQLQQILQETRQALAAGEQAFEFSLAFHKTLATATKNQALRKVYEGIARLMRDVSEPPLMAIADAAHLRLSEHEAIVKAVSARDVQAARDAMRHHLCTAHDWMSKTLSSNPQVNDGE